MLCGQHSGTCMLRKGCCVHTRRQQLARPSSAAPCAMPMSRRRTEFRCTSDSLSSLLDAALALRQNTRASLQVCHPLGYRIRRRPKAVAGDAWGVRDSQTGRRGFWPVLTSRQVTGEFYCRNAQAGVWTRAKKAWLKRTKRR